MIFKSLRQTLRGYTCRPLNAKLLLTHVGCEGTAHEFLSLPLLGLFGVAPMLEILQGAPEVLNIIFKLVHSPEGKNRINTNLLINGQNLQPQLTVSVKQPWVSAGLTKYLIQVLQTENLFFFYFCSNVSHLPQTVTSILTFFMSTFEMLQIYEGRIVSLVDCGLL